MKKVRCFHAFFVFAWEEEVGKLKGKVIMFMPVRGYGFILGEDEKNYFVHQTEILMDGFRFLQPDQQVSFYPVTEEKGLAATRVKILGGR